MRIGTLFSGIGAPEQGAKRVYKDLEMVFACEYDKFARESFQANYEIEPEHFHIDVNDMDGTQYKDKVDIIIGGSPCQAFSIAGLRLGLDDKRGQLIWQYHRIIMEASPEIFIYENVKGMVSDNNGKTLQDFLEVFRESGYFCHYAVLNTKEHGVPQNRERVYIIGFKDHELYHRFQFADKMKLETRLKDVLEIEVDDKYYLSDTVIKGFISHRDRMQERGNGFKFEPTDGDCAASSLTTRAGSRPDDNYIKVIGKLDIKGDDYIKRVYSVEGLCPAIPTCQGGHQEPKIMQERIRKLTPRECLRLQDFPDTFTQVVSNSQQYKQAGNSMSVNILEMIFRQIEKAKEKENTNTLMDFL